MGARVCVCVSVLLAISAKPNFRNYRASWSDLLTSPTPTRQRKQTACLRQIPLPFQTPDRLPAARQQGPEDFDGQTALSPDIWPQTLRLHSWHSMEHLQTPYCLQHVAH